MGRLSKLLWEQREERGVPPRGPGSLQGFGKGQNREAESWGGMTQPACSVLTAGEPNSVGTGYKKGPD